MGSHYRSECPSFHLAEGRTEDAPQRQASEQGQLQQQQPRQQRVRKPLSRRTLRSGVIFVAAGLSLVSFALPSISPYFRTLDDFQRRVLQSGDSRLLLSFGAAEMSMEPSIVQICRAIIEKAVPDGSVTVGDGAGRQEQRGSVLTVSETVHVCTSQSLFESMIGMYHSAVMAQTLNELGTGFIVRYTHDCQRFDPVYFDDANDDGEGDEVRRSTVQMGAHTKLLHVVEAANHRIQHMKNANKLDEITGQCSSILQRYEVSEPSTGSTLPSLLIPESMMSVMETNAMMEFMTVNTLYAATTTSIPAVNARSDAPVLSSDSASSDTAELPPPKRRLLANPESDAPSHDGEDTVLIYLDSNDVRALPLHYYAQYIPRSATNVRILTSPNLDTAKPTAVRNSNRVHVDLLQKYVAALVPRARIEVVAWHETGTLAAARSILEAGHLICPPGPDCWPAALARGRTNGPFEPSVARPARRPRTVLANVGGEPLPVPVAPARLPPALAGHIRILPGDAALIPKLARGGDAFVEATLALLRAPPIDRASCPAVRGRIGSWVPSSDGYAAKLQYVTPVDHIFGFADQRFVPGRGGDGPYRAPSTYRWIGDGSTEGTCPVRLVDLDSFCGVTGDLNVGRLFFVGDFVGMNQAYSLWKLLGNTDSPKPIRDSEPSWSRSVTCPEEGAAGPGNGTGGRRVQISFTRNDIMQENTKPVDLPRGLANCNGYLYCYKWTDRYMNYYQHSQEEQPEERRTILIASFGPHFYEEIKFQERMTDFLGTFETALKDRLAKDIVFFRTIAPGHDRCERKKNQLPFKDFEEYRPTISKSYSWDLHDGFNDIAERMIREFNDAHYTNSDGRQHLSTPEMDLLAPVHILDVYPMSVLRRDGHVSGPDCINCSIRHDCFHYSLPGPSDWWNHLMFSNLEDIAEGEKRLGQQQQHHHHHHHHHHQQQQGSTSDSHSSIPFTEDAVQEDETVTRDFRTRYG